MFLVAALYSKKEQEGLLNSQTELCVFQDYLIKHPRSLCIVGECMKISFTIAFEFPTYNFNQQDRTLKYTRVGGRRCYNWIFRKKGMKEGKKCLRYIKFWSCTVELLFWWTAIEKWGGKNRNSHIFIITGVVILGHINLCGGDTISVEYRVEKALQILKNK